MRLHSACYMSGIRPSPTLLTDGLAPSASSTSRTLFLCCPRCVSGTITLPEKYAFRNRAPGFHVLVRRFFLVRPSYALSRYLTVIQGQDSTSDQCVIGGSEGELSKANFWDHFGPYNGVEMLC